MDDQGKSAFKGEHVLEESALGGFLHKLEKKLLVFANDKILPLLVVEEIDRLTRLEPDDGQELLLRLMRYVDICVVEPSGCNYQLFSRKGNGSDIGSNILLLLKIYGAHDYSKKLSKRVRDAQDRSTLAAINHGKALDFGKCPYWLTKIPDGGYELSDKWASVIRKTFEFLIKGLTPTQVANRLNELKIPTASRERSDGGKGESLESSAKWTLSKVNTLMVNRRVIGWIKLKNHDTEINLYPAVVDDATFHKAVELAGKRKITTKNRLGTIKSLFAGFSYCYMCGERMHTDRRKRPSGFIDVRMKCSSRNKATSKERDCDCGYTNHEFESAFLGMIVDRIQVQDLLQNQSSNEEQSIRSQLSVVESELSEMHGMVSEYDDISIFKGIAQRNKRKKELEEKLLSINNFSDSVIKSNYNKIVEMSYSALDVEKEDLRAELHTLINGIVSRVELYKRDKTNIIIVNFKNGLRRQIIKNKNTSNEWKFIELTPALEK
ncbi:recombinase-related protein [Vibrio sp. MED222]|nr:recombinase-related protein [Vibrio sp. MED222]